MLLVKAVMALGLAAGAGTSALPDPGSLAPAGQPAGQPSLPPVAPPSAAAPAHRELPAAEPAASMLQEALRQVHIQLKLIEAKGRSLSTGLPFRRGRLRNPAQLPLEGFGFKSIRAYRNAVYGTDQLIAGLIEVCAELQKQDPATPRLAIGDLSGPKGGRIALHKSHRNGRDADIVFFWRDENGNPVEADEMLRFDRRGRATYKGKRILFDTPRNWALVRALLTSPRFGERVKFLFVSTHLRKMLLEYAEAREGDLYILERARRVMQEPGRRAGRHDDHFHLRINCSTEEILNGCRD